MTWGKLDFSGPWRGSREGTDGEKVKMDWPERSRVDEYTEAGRFGQGDSWGKQLKGGKNVNQESKGN